MKVLFVTYFDRKYLLGKICECRSSPEKLSTTEVGNYMACCYSLLSAENISMANTEMKTSRKLFRRFKRSGNESI